MLSIHTNAAAMKAVQLWNQAGAMLEETQQHLTTGQRVYSAKGETHLYTIANTLRADVAGYTSVKEQLSLATATTSVALNAGESISDLLIEMKALAVKAGHDQMMGDVRSKVHNDFQDLVTQIDVITDAANFNDNNLVKTGGNSLSVLSTVDGNTLSISAEDMSAAGLSLTGLSLMSTADATTARTAVDAAEQTLGDQLRRLGESYKQLNQAHKFAGFMSDTLQEGISKLVDADLTQDSATLQAAQARQALANQAVGMVMKTPLVVMSILQKVA